MAGLQNLYPNLPGMLTEFKDGGMALRADTGTANTGSMLILGTAIDGPVMEPVAVDINTVELVFGKDVKANGYSNGGTLVPAFKQAYKTGCRDIRLMRVTGSQAFAKLETPSTDVFSNIRKDEQISLVDGNEETVIKVSAPIVEATTPKVYVKGVLLQNGYTVDKATGKITIVENATDAGANVTVNYTRLKNVAETEVLTLDASFKGSVLNDIIEIVSVKHAGIEVDKALATFVGKEVTVAKYDESTNAVEGDEVAIEYLYASGETELATETSEDGVPFVTGTSLQVEQLLEVPVANSVHLYIDDAEILTENAFTVNIENQSISIKKELFSKGAQVSVSYYKSVSESVTASIEISSFFGGEVYNQGHVEVTEVKNEAEVVIKKILKITKPSEKKAQVSESPLIYSSDDHATFIQLIDKINNDLGNGVYKASTNFPDEPTVNLKVTSKNLISGENGIVVTKDEMHKALSGERDSEGYISKQGAYQLLEDYEVDTVVPTGVYADDSLSGRYDNFAYELALFCAVLSLRNTLTTGSIAMKPCNDTSLAGVQEYAKKVASYTNLYYMRDSSGSIIKDNNGKPIDLGKYIDVVCGPTPVISDGNLGSYFGNPAVNYASYSTTLKPGSAATNKELPGVKQLRFKFSNAQLDTISASRIITFKTKNDKACIVDAMTAAVPGSDYARSSTCAALRKVVASAKEACDPFIGEANSVEHKNAMSSAISKALSNLKNDGTIQDYAFNVIVTLQDLLLGNAKIELTIVPPQELRKISTVVSLTPAL